MASIGMKQNQKNRALKYEDNPDFNQSFDDDKGLISIWIATFQPSRVLFEMEPETYYQALLNYKDQEIAGLKALIQSEFPTPIANIFYRFEHGSENSNQRLETLRDVWESLIRLLFAIVVGEFICANFSMAEVNIDREYLFSEKLNNKLMVIRKLIELALRKGLNLSFLSILDIDIVVRLEKLNRVRNVFSHISALSEEQARQMIIDHFDDVLSVLRYLNRLSDVVFMRYIAQPRANIIRYEIFKGYAFNKKIGEISVKKSQIANYAQYFNNSCVLAMIGEHFFSMSPFLHFVIDGHDTKLCFYTKKEGKEPNRKFLYEVPATSRIEKIDEAAFVEEINRINLLVPAKLNSKKT